jgi:hypothetical protein
MNPISSIPALREHLKDHIAHVLHKNGGENLNKEIADASLMAILDLLLGYYYGNFRNAKMIPQFATFEQFKDFVFSFDGDEL